MMNMAEQATVPAKQKKKRPKFSGKFFRELKNEFSKITWPTRKQILNNTVIVISAVLILGIFIWGFDAGFGWLVRFVLNRA